MEKIRFKCNCSFVIAAIMCVVLFAPAASAADKDGVIKIRFNTNAKSEGAKGSASQQAFKKELEKLTNGKVKVEFYYGWMLANSTEAVVGGLQTGGFEMSDWSVGSFAEYSKAFMPLDVPYLIANKEVAYEIMRGDVGQMMSDRFLKDSGIRVVMLTDLGFRHITNNKKPITSPEDLKGLKIRTQNNPLHIQGFKALGAAPTPIAFSELFTALQQGVVDGQENPIFHIFGMKLYEVQKYLSLTSHLYTAGAFIMSDKFYKNLPEDVQAAINQAAIVAREANIVDVAANEAEWLAAMEGKIEINKLNDEQILAMQEVSKKQWPSMAKVIGEDYFNSLRVKIEEIQSRLNK